METIVVNYAARAVGSLDGQLAKLAGRRVIGFAGTKEKIERSKIILRFHKVAANKWVFFFFFVTDVTQS